MSIIYKENGDFDVSDDGKQVDKLNSDIDRELMLSKLPPRVQKKGRLIYEGYNYNEIGKKMGCTENAIKQVVKRYRHFIGVKLV